MDDILLAGKSIWRISEVKEEIAKRFKVKDMGELHHFLGVKVIQNPKAETIWMGQPMYIESTLKKFKMENVKATKTPVNPSLKLTIGFEESKEVDQGLYQSAVGKLLYLSTKTRPDIAFAVSYVAKFCNRPTAQHWKAIKQILRYLAGTINVGLVFRKIESQECIGYSDADWASDLDRKSTSGFVFQIGGTSVSWQSKKQPCVALSTAEAEYIALANAAQEAIWIRKLVSELKKEPAKPIVIYEDNQSAICMSKNPQFHE